MKDVAVIRFVCRCWPILGMLLSSQLGAAEVAPAQQTPPVISASDGSSAQITRDGLSQVLYGDTPPPSAYDLQQRQQGNPTFSSDESDFVSQGARTIFVLIAIVALIYLSLRLLRRYMGKGMLKGDDEQLQIINRTHLDQKHLLCIIKVGARYFLIGSSDQGMVLLSELSAEDVFAHQRGGETPSQSGGKGPLSAFSRLLSHKQHPSSNEGENGDENG